MELIIYGTKLKGKIYKLMDSTQLRISENQELNRNSS